MVADETGSLINDYAVAHAAAFPGSSQAQGRPCDVVSERANNRNGHDGSPTDAYKTYFYATVFHTDFAPDWPIATDWPAVVRGLRGSFGLTQIQFADQLGVGRATLERWETGKTVPLRGDSLELLTWVRPHLRTPLQAGQALNLAAAAVLPHLTRPTSEYRGSDVVGPLRRGKHDHTDLGPALLSALETARILIAIEPGTDELDTLYFPLAGRLGASTSVPPWARGIVDDLSRLSTGDRELVAELAHRLAAGK
jgi:transcriptional regulator with XRE-family HTH domain